MIYSNLIGVKYYAKFAHFFKDETQKFMELRRKLKTGKNKGEVLMKLIEKVFNNTQTNEKKIEKVIADDHVHYMHMVLPKGEGLPIHYSNANLYMTVVRGKLSISLDDNEVNKYEQGTVLNIPYNVKMVAKNFDDEILELIVVKTPAPGDYYSK